MNRGGPAAARRHRMPPAVWVLLALHTLLLLAYTALAPVYRAADEPHHVDLALAVSRGQAWPWPDPDARQDSEQVIASLAAANYLNPASPRDREPAPFRADDAPERGERPAFADLAADRPSAFRNQMPQHPPLGYVVSAVPLLLPGAEAWPFDRTVAALRLVSVLLVAPLPVLAFQAARTLTGDDQVSLAAATVPLAVPQLTHTGSVMGNDALLIALFGALTTVLARVLREDLGYRTAVAAGVLTGAALLTKGFALVAPVWVMGAYAMTAWRSRPVSRAVGPAVVALLTGSTIGGWWWVRNALRYGSVQPDGMEPRPAAGPDFVPDLGRYAADFTTLLVERYWGSFGWLQLPLPRPVAWAAAALLAVGVASALARAGPPPGLPRRDGAVLLWPTVGIAAIVLAGSLDFYLTHGGRAGIQGRYLLPGLTGLAVLCTAGYGSLGPAVRRWLPLAVLTVAIALQATAVATLLHGFWMAPADAGPADAWRALLAWSPWPPALLVAASLGICALTAALAATLALKRNGRVEPCETVDQRPAR